LYPINYIKDARRLRIISWIFSELEKTIGVERFDLLLFPSHLLHHTPKNIGNDLKISLAFNTSKPII
jgi:hypothetical protein